MLYRTDSFVAGTLVTVEDDDPYWLNLRKAYAEGLAALVEGLSSPPAAWGGKPIRAREPAR
jgi:predicted proteasome-type protease